MKYLVKCVFPYKIYSKHNLKHAINQAHSTNLIMSHIYNDQLTPKLIINISKATTNCCIISPKPILGSEETPFPNTAVSQKKAALFSVTLGMKYGGLRCEPAPVCIVL